MPDTDKIIPITADFSASLESAAKLSANINLEQVTFNEELYAKVKMQLIEMLEELVENPEIEKIPNLKDACCNFLLSKEIQALITLDWIVMKIYQFGLPDFLLTLWELLQSLQFTYPPGF